MLKFKEKSFDLKHAKLAFELIVWTTVYLTPLPPVNYQQIPLLP